MVQKMYVWMIVLVRWIYIWSDEYDKSIPNKSQKGVNSRNDSPIQMHSFIKYQFK